MNKLLIFFTSVSIFMILFARVAFAQEVTPSPSPSPAPSPTSIPTPTPTPSPRPTCFVVAYSFGMNVTATITTLRAVEPILYFFNFNDGAGDRNFTSPTMTHLYNVPGTYRTSAFVIDANGQSDRCSSEPYVIALIVTPTPIPTPTITITPTPVFVAGTVSAVSQSAGELPKTGPSFFVWALFMLVPVGILLKKFKSVLPKGNIARFLCEKRRFFKNN